MTMTNEQCFEIWAPDASPWSAWAKPVLFSQMSATWTARGEGGLDEGVKANLPAFASDQALVVDLNGTDAVRVGLELARRGWRPVPLFNATTAPKSVVNVMPTMELLWTAGEQLAQLTISPDAPPAFLLDAQRMQGDPRPGDYDNRSLVLPQDFPSATLLRSRGITSALLIQTGSSGPREDLCHVLLRWQQGGVRLGWVSTAGGRGDLQVSPPSMFRSAWYRLIILLGFRRNNVGGFGGAVPEVSSGGGGFG
jgi:hypothetical protein